jgi:hypothetical protein
MTDKVVRCDLRPHDQADAALKEVTRLLTDPSKPDLTMLLVLDTPQNLTKHAVAYEELWRSRRVERLLGIAVGSFSLPDGLQLPWSMGSDRDSGVIWVGDVDGVDWRLTASAIANAHPSNQSETGLDRLVNILSTPQVFTKTLDLLADIPERVASPGLNIFEVTASQTMFLASLNRAIKKILHPDVAAQRTKRAAVEGLDWTVDQVHSTVLPSGRLATARDRCLAEAEALTETADALGTPSALYGAGRLGARARDLAIRAGTELGSYRTDAQRIVATPTPERADRLYDWGIRPAGSSGSSYGDIAAAIDASLRAGESLTLISFRLREYERKIRAHGELAYTEQIGQLYPHTLEQRFTEPERMPGPEPWLVAVGAIACAAAALGRSFGIVAGLVVALTWMGLLGLTVARAPGGRISDHYGPLITDGIAAVLGLAGGFELSREFRPSTVVGATGFLVGFGIVVATATWSWRVRTRRWRENLQDRDLARVAEELTNVVVTAANREWSAGEARQDAIITARATIDGAASALLAYQQKIERDLSHVPVRYPTKREFDEFVERGLALLVANALHPILQTPKPGSPREQEELANKEVTDLLAKWDQYVDYNGPLDLPEFANEPDMHVSVLNDNDIATIITIITSDPREIMWQLCQSVDIRLLDAGITRVAAVRFAPRAVLLNSTGTFSVETEWIGSTKTAGLMRLVPLRPGIVSRLLSLTDDALTDEPPAAGGGPEGQKPTDSQEAS